MVLFFLFLFRPDFVPLPCPCDSSYPASHLTKDASLQQAALLSIDFPFIDSCEVLVLKPVFIMLMQAGLGWIISPAQASKALFFAKVTPTV